VIEAARKCRQGFEVIDELAAKATRRSWSVVDRIRSVLDGRPAYPGLKEIVNERLEVARGAPFRLMRTEPPLGFGSSSYPEGAPSADSGP